MNLAQASFRSILCRIIFLSALIPFAWDNHKITLHGKMNAHHPACQTLQKRSQFLGLNLGMGDKTLMKIKLIQKMQ